MMLDKLLDSVFNYPTLTDFGVTPLTKPGSDHRPSGTARVIFHCPVEYSNMSIYDDNNDTALKLGYQGFERSLHCCGAYIIHATPLPLRLRLNVG